MGEEVRGHCWSCGRGLTRLDYGREAACPGCGKPTHVCRNCRHYAPGRSNDCREPVAEPVLTKDRANFCDWFQPSPAAAGPGQDPLDPGALRRAADELFK